MSHRWLAWSLAILVLAVVAGLTLAAPRSATAPTGTPSIPQAASPAELSAWQRFDPGPLVPRTGASTVWTGTELLVWGGAAIDGSGGLDDGAAYDPATGRWRMVASAPITGGDYGQVATWTGEALMSWSRGQAASYDPTTDRWRQLPDSPLDPETAPLAALWTDQELVVIGDRSRERSAGTAGAVYEPAAGAWRDLPAAPVTVNVGTAVWTGHEVVVFGAAQDGNNRVRAAGGLARGAAYDPATEAWRELPTSPVSGQAATAVWTGDALLAWSYELDDAALYDPEADAWRPAPDLPLAFRECYPSGMRVGDQAYASHCGRAAIYEPSLDRWRRADQPQDLYGDVVWTGRQLLSWGSITDHHRTEAWSTRGPGRPEALVDPRPSTLAPADG